MPLDRASRITQMCKKDAKNCCQISNFGEKEFVFFLFLFFPESELSPQIRGLNN